LVTERFWKLFKILAKYFDQKYLHHSLQLCLYFEGFNWHCFYLGADCDLWVIFCVLNITLVLILTSSIIMSNSLFLRIDDKEMNSLRIAWLSNINPFASYHLKALLCKPTLRAKETSSVAALIELKVKLESDNSRTIARVGIDPDLAFRSNGGLELLDIGTV